MTENSWFYVIYDDYLITICSRLDDVFDELAEGGTIFGYTDNEEMAQSMLRECFHELAARNR
jgi:tRNA G46 methylase TrmB